MSTTLESKDIGFRKAEFVAKTHFLYFRFNEEGLGHIGISTTRGFIKQIQDFANIC